ncbi:flavin reductase family protein [Microbacterium trichothecenolyticum]|uniref:Flavin reductase (DIM6/NTAB) family NADH-FMN oxidoreductase RutF n=1 Tax=Microbacterium trichothecenolyticum TaxID=69370 RepID=A0ABU0TPA5_MICTR|nr:flavin reductase family protein [Microbacterium trichothecenolyticum]MDQ1121499.1 flavin reductase (DIM6/NTAB) family NADH-FMN oxidoreductase RutF [Microbacterium trichothecenolyticum]
MTAAPIRWEPLCAASDIAAAFAHVPAGVASVAAMVEGVATAMVVSSFAAGVSYEPPMVSFAVQLSSTTWPELVGAPRLGVSVLGEAHAEKTRQLASRDRARRLDDVAWATTPTGAVLLEGSPVWLECAVEHRYPAGDHELVVLRVEHLVRHADRVPIVWHRRRAHTLRDGW